MAPPPDPTITMTSFGDFTSADSQGQLAKVREVMRQYDQDYNPGKDFWRAWRNGVQRIHSRSEDREQLARVWESAKHNRSDQYRSACEGYFNFWVGSR